MAESTQLIVPVGSSPYLNLFDIPGFSRSIPFISNPSGAQNSVAFSGDNARLYISGTSQITQVYDSATWDFIPGLSLPGVIFGHISIDIDGTILARTNNTQIEYFSTVDFSPVGTAPPLDSGGILANRISSTGLFCNYGGLGSRCNVRAVSDAAELVLDVIGQRVNGTCWWLNESKAVFATNDGVHIYESAGWTKERHIDPATETTCYSVDVSHDGKWLATGWLDGEFLKVYDTSDYSEISIPVLPTARIRHVRFSAESKYLLAVSDQAGSSIWIYDTADWSQTSYATSSAPVAGAICDFNNRGVTAPVTLKPNLALGRPF